jgi:dihydroorotate dehydrogenase (NAD+) catalytic subunit
LSSNLLTVNVAGLKLHSPTALASGVLGYTATSMQMVAKNGAGVVVTKSIGISPRTGYPNPSVVQARSGLINAMGLPNPGIDEYRGEIEFAKTIVKVPLIVSVFGYSADEYALVARKAVEAGADAVELNVSCPHVQYTGSEIGQNKKLLAEVVKKVKEATSAPLFVKLSPNVTDIVDLAKAAVSAGADGLVAINTVRALAIDVETQRPILSNIKGGLSGGAIKPVALRCVYDIYEALPKTPIIGCGGVMNWQDAVEFFLAGAVTVQVGTSIAFEDTNIFQTINRGITSYLQRKGYRSVHEVVGLSHQE